jgi:hypothetical protein
MNHGFQILSTLALLATVGCGPPRFGTDPNGDETDSGELSSDSSSDTDASADATTNGFFVPFADVDGGAECDEFMQDCPEGEKCVPYSTDGGIWNANKCVPVTGDNEPGEPCVLDGITQGTDDCDATGICWDAIDVDGQLIGTCYELCKGTPDNPECPEGASCAVDSNGHINVCVPDCDPLLQDCGSGNGCYWVGNEFNCAFSSRELPTGAQCGYINDCAPGHLCAVAEALPSCAGASCCTPFCDLEVGDEHCQTMPGTNCVPFFAEGEALPGYELVGVCTLPP